jgi:hypothetical protein
MKKSALFFLDLSTIWHYHAILTLRNLMLNLFYDDNKKQPARPIKAVITHDSLIAIFIKLSISLRKYIYMCVGFF